MDYTALMRESNCAAHLVCIGQQRREDRQFACLKQAAQGLSLDKLHAEINKVFFLAHVIDSDDVGMVQSTSGLGFLL